MQENPTNFSENPLTASKKTQNVTDAKAFFLSLVATGLVVAFCVVMFALTQLKNLSINNVEQQTADLKTKIATLQADKSNTVASLITADSIPSVQLEPLILQFRAAANSAQVQFQGFDIQNDTISTNLIAQNTDKDAVQKIIAMMKNFAKDGQQGTFSLEPILTIAGDRNTRTTPITFKIIPKQSTETTQAHTENTAGAQ